MTLPASNNGNPFPGLRSFEREQADLFFGRDEQTRELIVRLQQHRFLPIVGMSGSGKSSLVRAGLIPALTGSYDETDTSGWRIALFRPSTDPMHELAVTLCREFAIPESDAVLKTLRGSSAGLARVAQEHVGREEKLLVLVDQFEELFRYGEVADGTGEADDDEAFVKLLLAATGNSELPLPGLDDVPVYVVTTMRSDFLGKCSRFRGLPEALNQSQYLIPRLTREQQRDAIEGPVGIAGARMEPALVQLLLNDLGDNQDQLPALQHALMRSWEQSEEARAQGKAIAVADYEAIGGMADALNRDADRVYASLSRYDTAIARCLFQRLVQPGAADGETRSPTPLSELVAITDSDGETVKRIIDVFKERGFLTVSSDHDPIIDIPHESLIRGWQRLATWVQEEAESSKIYCRLTDTAELHAQGKTSWFVNPELQTTLKWREEQNPNKAWAARYDSRFAQAMEFLQQSQKKHEETLDRTEQQRRSELKRARVTALVLGTLALVAIVASIFAFMLWKRTLTERDRSNRLLYDSNVYFASGAVAAGQSTLARERLYEVLDAGLKDLRGFEWLYLWRAAHVEKATLSGHFMPVRSVAVSPDGTTLASASDDGTVKLWDVTARKEVTTFLGHSAAVWSVAFSPDGKTLASAGSDATVKLWDIAARKEIANWSGHSGAVFSVAFSPDGNTLVSAGRDDKVTLWDIATRKQVASLSGHSRAVWSVTFSPDGKTLASASEDRTVKLWDITTQKVMVTLTGHSSSVLSVAFSPDSKTLVSGSGDKTTKLWDIAMRKEVATFSEHSASVWSVAFSSDGRTVASASSDKTIKLWDVATHKQVGNLSGHFASVVSVAFLRDGQTLTSASVDHTVKLWNVRADKEVATLSGHSGAVWSVAFSPDGKTLASSSQDATVKLWDVAMRNEVATLSRQSGSVGSVTFSTDGKTLAYTCGEKAVRLWDVAVRKEMATLSSHPNPSSFVSFSPDGKTLASTGVSGTVTLWDVAAGKELTTLLGHSDQVRSVAFSPDGKTLASSSEDKTVKLWDTRTQKEVTTLPGHSSTVLSVAFSPDGKSLVSGSGDSTIILWDVATGKLIARSYGHSSSVLSVAFSPDGKTLASASFDNTIKLWDIATLKEVATLSGHSGPVWSVVFSPDGKTLASSSDDKTVRLWFAATDQEVEEQRRRGY